MNEKPLASGQNYLCKAAICTKKDLKDDEVFFLSFFQLKKCILQPPRRKQSALISSCFACGGHKMFLTNWLTNIKTSANKSTYLKIPKNLLVTSVSDVAILLKTSEKDFINIGNEIMAWNVNGRVAQRITRLPTEQKIAGSNPAAVKYFF